MCFLTCRFDGGCKYPYLSEVARDGWGWWLFFLGTLMGWIPWILFGWSYYKAFCMYAIAIEVEWRRHLFLFFQKVYTIFLTDCAVCSGLQCPVVGGDARYRLF